MLCWRHVNANVRRTAPLFFASIVAVTVGGHAPRWLLYAATESHKKDGRQMKLAHLPTTHLAIVPTVTQEQLSALRGQIEIWNGHTL